MRPRDSPAKEISMKTIGLGEAMIQCNFFFDVAAFMCTERIVLCFSILLTERLKAFRCDSSEK